MEVSPQSFFWGSCFKTAFISLATWKRLILLLLPFLFPSPFPKAAPELHGYDISLLISRQSLFVCGLSLFCFVVLLFFFFLPTLSSISPPFLFTLAKRIEKVSKAEGTEELAWKAWTLKEDCYASTCRILPNLIFESLQSGLPNHETNLKQNEKENGNCVSLLCLSH